MALSREHRAYLNWVETTPSWQEMPVADLKARIADLLDRYSAAESVIARMMLEFSLRVREAMAHGDDPDSNLRDEVAIMLAELDITAAALTRKERGKPPL
jgi:hypothetical protein